MVANIFTCPGDVAQLGERLGRIEEVEGSIPFVSTTGYVKASVTRPFSCLSSLLSPRRSDMHRPQAQGCASKHTRCVMRLAARTRPTLPPRATSLDITPRTRHIRRYAIHHTSAADTPARRRGRTNTPPETAGAGHHKASANVGHRSERPCHEAHHRNNDVRTGRARPHA